MVKNNIKIISLLLLVLVISGCSNNKTISRDATMEEYEQLFSDSTDTSESSSSINTIPPITNQATTTEIYANLIPISKGSYWLYRITGEQLIDNGQGNELIKTNKLFKVEVLNYTKRDPNLQAALLTGFPNLMNWETSTLIIVADKDYYVIAGEEAFNRVLNKRDDLSGIYSNAYLMLQFPVTVGKKFGCGEDDMDRKDNYYCNWVKSIKPADAKLYPNKNEYQIAFYTNPDAVDFSYVNDVGITYYNYSHNGTLVEEKWELVKYFIAK